MTSEYDMGHLLIHLHIRLALSLLVEAERALGV